MEKLELVIFDMDGLMFDTEKLSYRIWKETVTEYGFQFTDAFYLSMIGSNLERIKGLCLKEFGEIFPFDEIKEVRYKRTNDLIKKDGLPVKKGLMELLTFLKSESIKTAVATSSSRDRANIFLKETNVTNFFDTIVCGDEITYSKPDPDIFLTVAKKLNCDPKNTIVLEDSDAGINAAYSGGMKPILVPDIKKPSDEILKMTFQHFDSLLDVKNYIEFQLLPRINKA